MLTKRRAGKPHTTPVRRRGRSDDRFVLPQAGRRLQPQPGTCQQPTGKGRANLTRSICEGPKGFSDHLACLPPCSPDLDLAVSCKLSHPILFRAAAKPACRLALSLSDRCELQASPTPRCKHHLTVPVIFYACTWLCPRCVCSTNCHARTRRRSDTVPIRYCTTKPCSWRCLPA